MAIYSGFSHSKWWFSIAMLIYQRVWIVKTSCGLSSPVDRSVACWFHCRSLHSYSMKPVHMKLCIYIYCIYIYILYNIYIWYMVSCAIIYGYIWYYPIIGYYLRCHMWFHPLHPPQIHGVCGSGSTDVPCTQEGDSFAFFSGGSWHRMAAVPGVPQRGGVVSHRQTIGGWATLTQI